MIKKLQIFNVCGWLFFLAGSPIKAADQTTYSDAAPQPQTRGVWSSVQAVKTNAIWIVSSVWWGGWGAVTSIFNAIKRIFPSRKIPKSPEPSTPLVVVDGSPYNRERLDLGANGNSSTLVPVSQSSQHVPKRSSGDLEGWHDIGRAGSGSPNSMMYFPDDEPKKR